MHGISLEEKQDLPPQQTVYAGTRCCLLGMRLDRSSTGKAGLSKVLSVSQSPCPFWGTVVPTKLFGCWLCSILVSLVCMKIKAKHLNDILHLRTGITFSCFRCKFARKKPQPTQWLAQNSSQEGAFDQEERRSLGNSFVEFINVHFSVTNSFLLPSLPEEVGGKHGPAVTKGPKSEEK